MLMAKSDPNQKTSESTPIVKIQWEHKKFKLITRGSENGKRFGGWALEQGYNKEPVDVKAENCPRIDLGEQMANK